MSSTITYPTLRPGDGYRDQKPQMRAYVKAAQIALGEHGVATTIDGYFGRHTEDSVRQFQREQGIEVDGIIGAETWSRLQPAVNSPAAGSPAMTGSQLADALVNHSTAALAARRTRIVRVAEGFLGQEEFPDNRGFRDRQFENLMRSVGWWTSAAWCDFFAELVWTTAYSDAVRTAAIIRRLMSGATLRSFKALKDSGVFRVTPYPMKGALAYWRHSMTTGHVGIVTDDGGATAYFHTIEGNTNDQGGREGYIVARKTRAKGDRQLLGFVQPIETTI